MKFYTMDWWRGVQCSENDDPTPDFQKHLATIRDQLPVELLALQESVSLHDSNIRKTTYNAEANTLVIALDGDDGQGGLRQFRLCYIDVLSFQTTVDREHGLPGPGGYGDLGYDEADITDEGDLVHRLLFSTGIEFQIVFRGFELQWRDVT